MWYERRHSFLRVAALVLPVLFLIAAGSLSAQIQIPECRCKYVTLRVEKEVACKATFRVSYELSGVQTDYTVEPGGALEIRCEERMWIAVSRCDNQFVPIPLGGCIINLNAGLEPMCCVDACLLQGKDGCWTALVRPTISMAPGCSCRD